MTTPSNRAAVPRDPQRRGRTCPQCGGALIAHPAQARETIARTMVQHGSPAPYAANFAAAVHEKEQRVGVVHTCAQCAYILRLGGAPADTEDDAA